MKLSCQIVRMRKLIWSYTVRICHVTNDAYGSLSGQGWYTICNLSLFGWLECLNHQACVTWMDIYVWLIDYQHDVGRGAILFFFKLCIVIYSQFGLLESFCLFPVMIWTDSFTVTVWHKIYFRTPRLIYERLKYKSITIRIKRFKMRDWFWRNYTHIAFSSH